MRRPIQRRAGVTAVAALLLGAISTGPAGADESPAHQSSWARSGLQGTLTADAALGSTIGYSTALSADGTTAVLGAPDANGYGGAVYVYHRTGQTWKQDAVLTESDVKYGQIGFSVAVSDDGRTIVAGAEGSGGRVYVFTRTRTTWEQSAEFAPPAGGGLFDALGYSVSIDGDGSTIAAGDFGRYTDRGAVFVYDRTASGWSSGTELTATDSAAYDDFGYANGVSISKDGTMLAVGAKGRNHVQGAVYTFARHSGSWTQTAELTASDGAAKNGFGQAVALAGTGDTLVIGAPYHGTGSAYVFRRCGSSWTQTDELQPGGKNDFPSDAIKVGISGDGSVIGVGLPSRNLLTGAAAIYVRGGRGFTQRATLVPSESVGVTGGAGTAIAISADGHTALVGAPYVYGDFVAGVGFIYRDTEVNPILNADIPTPTSQPTAPSGASNASQASMSQATSQPHVSDIAGRHPILGQEHRTATVCPAPSVGSASCDAQVVTDDALHPLTGATYTDGYTPAQLRSAYGLSGVNGSSLVAVVDAYANPDAQASLNAYRKQFGLGPLHLTQVNENGGATLPAANTGWGTEEMLDLEMISAACPTCSILYVGADSASFDDLGTAVNTAVKMGAKVVSNSYGGDESADEAQIQQKYYDHPGVAITASSGDEGYGVSQPAAFGSVIAVGGTSLTLTASGARATEKAWGDAGSGCSRFVAKPQWQRDGYCGRRTVADVSAVADPDTGVAVYDVFNGGWLVVGGTSVSAPFIAGVYGLTGHTSGQPARRLYQAPAGSLFDVAAGLNGTCSKAYLCGGAPGYDGPTGAGSPNGVGAF